MVESTRLRAMVVVAHPDDADFIAAGTMGRWVREGVDVILVVVTDGSKGSEDLSIPPEQLRAIREDEQRKAAAHLGLHRVVFLGQEDGLLEDRPELRKALVRLIREWRPDRVVCQDPTVRWRAQRYINHPDHIAAGSATLAAVYPLARNSRSFIDLLDEGLVPHKVRELYLAGSNDADCWIDIGETIEYKISALMEHRSQIGNRDIGEFVRQWARDSAAGHGMEYAEAYKYFELS